MVPLKIKIPKLRQLGEVRRKRAGEMVEAEAEGAERGQVGEGVGRKSSEERRAREAENGDAAVLTQNALPVAWGGEGGVPEKGAAADGGAEGQEGCPIGGEI